MLDPVTWIALLVSVAFTVIGVKEFRFAKLCFVGAAAVIVLRAFFWAFTELNVKVVKPVGMGLIFVLILLVVGPALWRALRWVDDKRAESEIVIVPTTPAPPRVSDALNVEPIRQPKGITPQQLRALFDGYTDIQAQTLAAEHLGEWVEWSGPFHNASPSSSSVQVTFEHRAFGEASVYAYFNDKKWKDKLSILRPGQHIRVGGTITKISRVWIDLQDCELLEIGPVEPKISS